MYLMSDITLGATTEQVKKKKKKEKQKEKKMGRETTLFNPQLDKFSNLLLAHTISLQHVSTIIQKSQSRNRLNPHKTSNNCLTDLTEDEASHKKSLDYNAIC